MFRACIFDLDGTILDTVESIAHVANLILEEFHLPTHPVEAYKYYAGDGASQLMRRALRASGDEELKYFEEADRRYRAHFAEDPLYRVKHFEGMQETLQKLKEAGAKLAVFSNKPHPAAIKVVEKMFGSDCFDYVQGQEASVPRKPDPTGALVIAEKFGVKPEECMYVGDTNTDMQTGNSAGMYTIGVTWGFRERKELEENHAQVIIDRPEELLKLQRQE